MQFRFEMILSSIPCYARLCNPAALVTEVFNLAFVFPNCSPKVHVSLWAVCYRKFVSHVAVWMVFKLVEGIATWSTPSSSTSFTLDRSSHIQSYTMYQTYSCMCVCVCGGGGGGGGTVFVLRTPRLGTICICIRNDTFGLAIDKFLAGKVLSAWLVS